MTTDKCSAPDIKMGLRRDIQGLRAIAVLAVMIFHMNRNWLPGGFVGVDIFLVISGYLITSLILLREKECRFSLGHFYWDRIKRIVPACYFMLVVISIISALLFIPKDFSLYQKSLNSSLFFFSNQYFSGFGSYFAPSSHELPLLHTWSLAVEMQFYLVLPLLIVWLPIRYLKLIIVAMIVVFSVYVEYRLRVDGQRQEMYFSLIARIPEFLIGVWAAIIGPGKKWSYKFSNLMGMVGIVLLILSLFLINEAHLFPGLIVLVPCLATVMLIAARGSLPNRFLSNSLLVWIGGLSYSLYLWHWPILSLMRYYVGQYTLESSWLIVFFFVTLIISWLSLEWVEAPFRRLKNYRMAIKKFMPLIIGGFSLTLISGRVNSSVANFLPDEMTRYANPDEICHGKMVGDCIRGDHSSVTPFLLLGDSHGAQLNYFFDAAGSADKFDVRIITGSSCVPIPGFDVERLPQWAQADCRAQIKSAKYFIDDAKIIIIAGMWEYQTKSKNFMVALDTFLKDTNTKKKKILVMAQIPMFTSNMVRVQRFYSLGLPAIISQNAEWKNANFKIAELVKKYPLVKFIDFSESDFFANAPYEDGLLIYQDSHHLNEIGARRYGAYAAPYFKNLLH